MKHIKNTKGETTFVVPVSAKQELADAYLNLDIQDMEGEIWNDIPFYDGIYQASNLGRIKSVERIDANGKLRKARIMKQSVSKKWNQLYVGLRQPGGKSTTTIVASCVGMAFLGLREDFEVFAHRNKNTLDNRLINIIKVARSISAFIDYEMGKTKVKGFAGTPFNGKRKYSQSKKGTFANTKKYQSELGSFTWSQLIEKFGKQKASAIYSASKRGYLSLGVKWNAVALSGS